MSEQAVPIEPILPPGAIPNPSPINLATENDLLRQTIERALGKLEEKDKELFRVNFLLDSIGKPEAEKVLLEKVRELEAENQKLLDGQLRYLDANRKHGEIINRQNEMLSFVESGAKQMYEEYEKLVQAYRALEFSWGNVNALRKQLERRERVSNRKSGIPIGKIVGLDGKPIQSGG